LEGIRKGGEQHLTDELDIEEAKERQVAHLKQGDKIPVVIKIFDNLARPP
jgi:hypothetical protein